jgi:uncharacterized protein involved in outer membrane biogenesis
MKRWLLWLGCIAGAFVALMLIAGLIARSLVGGSAKQELVSALSGRLGVPVTVGDAKLDLVSFLLLKPAVSLEDIAIGNPPGYRGSSLLAAKRISAQVALLPLVHRRIEVRSILIDAPRIAVETGAGGTTNIEQLLKTLSGSSGTADPPAGQASATSLNIADFRVASGDLLISGTDPAQPPLRIGDITLRLQDLSATTSCRLEASGKLFGGRESGFRVEGRAGPFTSAALPLDGTLSLTVAPGEIPERIRREQFGVLLGAPGGKAKATLDASIRGDLYGALAGPAKLTLAHLLIGKDASHQMQMDGEAPASFSVQKPMSAPLFQLQVRNAALKLGEGQWKGSADLQMRGSALSASSRGSIVNVDINTLLSSLTASGGGKIYGTAAIPSYTVQCAGKSAEQMRNSLTGTAKLSVAKGRIAMLDLLASIERALGPAQSETAGGNTSFSTLTADLNIANSKLALSNIVFDGPGLQFTGSGTIGFDHAMHFDLDTRVTGGLASAVNRLTRQPNASQAALPVVIAGTVDKPQVRPSMSKLATGAVQGLIQSLFNKNK